MKLFGLIGYPLTHSWSALYFNRKFKELRLYDYDYRLFQLEQLDGIMSLVNENVDLQGLNVTLPYKVEILSYLDDIQPEAKDAGCVNCIRILRSSATPKLMGYNTDIAGFSQSLLPLLEKHHSKALVLGSGGASRAVVHVLKQLGISYTLVSRNRVNADSIAYSDINEDVMDESTLIINTTPLGMFPKIEEFPEIPYQYIGKRHLLYDLVYNPDNTIFLQKGRLAGAKVKNGLEMLQLQAENSWVIWMK